MMNWFRKMRKFLSSRPKFFRLGVGVGIFIIGYFFLLPIFLILAEQPLIFNDVENVNPTSVGIVFGARVYQNKVPSAILEDRLLAALELYKAHKISKIFVSGDNRFDHYNEPEVMYQYLIVAGVPAEDVVRDFAGRRTYDTCARAKEIWNIPEAILITQSYHLPRALLTCNSLGVKSVGYSATRQHYLAEAWYFLREFPALHKTLIDLYVWSPNYVKGEKEDLIGQISRF